MSKVHSEAQVDNSVAFHDSHLDLCQTLSSWCGTRMSGESVQVQELGGHRTCCYAAASPLPLGQPEDEPVGVHGGVARERRNCTDGTTG